MIVQISQVRKIELCLTSEEIESSFQQYLKKYPMEAFQQLLIRNLDELIFLGILFEMIT